MRTIMVATDFSERSDRALRRAVMLAKETGAALVLVHAIDDDQPYEILEAKKEKVEGLLARMSATLKSGDGLACAYHVVFGSPFAKLAQATVDHKADLLVLGPHRRQILRDIFVGTTAERTIRSVQCPVLMTNAAAAGSYRRVVFATDLSDPSREAIEVAKALGIAGHAISSLLYVFDAPTLRLAMSHTLAKDKKEHILLDESVEAARQLAEFATSLNAEDVEQLVRHDEMTPAVEILAAAEEISADLIVVGTHGRRGVARLLLGSVAEEILRRADRDVLAVPPKAAE